MKVTISRAAHLRVCTYDISIFVWTHERISMYSGRYSVERPFKATAATVGLLAGLSGHA